MTRRIVQLYQRITNAVRMARLDRALAKAKSPEEMERVTRATMRAGFQALDAERPRVKAIERGGARVTTIAASAARILIATALITTLAVAVLDFTSRAARDWLNTYQVGVGILGGLVMLAGTYAVVEYLIGRRAETRERQAWIAAAYFSLSRPMHLCWRFLAAMESRQWEGARKVYMEYRRTLRREQPHLAAHPALADRLVRFRYMQGEMWQLLKLYEKLADAASAEAEREAATSLQRWAREYELHVREAASLHVRDGGYRGPADVPTAIVEERFGTESAFASPWPLDETQR